MFWSFRDLILSFSKLLNQEASYIPSGQHALNEEYYKRIEAIQFTMNHDDGNSTDDIQKSYNFARSREPAKPQHLYTLLTKVIKFQIFL